MKVEIVGLFFYAYYYPSRQTDHILKTVESTVGPAYVFLKGQLT
jgi:hypothetical protein